MFPSQRNEKMGKYYWFCYNKAGYKIENQAYCITKKNKMSQITASNFENIRSVQYQHTKSSTDRVRTTANNIKYNLSTLYESNVRSLY